MAKVIFTSLIKQVAEDTPIIPMKDYDWQWFSRMRKFLRSYEGENLHVNRCPAINSVLNIGWIQRAYTDIYITRNDILEVDQFGTVRQDIMEGHTNGQKEYGQTGIDWFIHDHDLEFHSPHQFSQFRTMHTHTNATIIKFTSPWFVEVPSGYSLWLMPIPYPDNCSFQSSIGTLQGTNWLNVQLFWHRAGHTGMIKKGTPLNYMVLVKDENPKYEVKGLEPKEAASYIRNRYYKFDDKYLNPSMNFSPPEETRKLLQDDDWKFLTKKEWKMKRKENDNPK